MYMYLSQHELTIPEFVYIIQFYNSDPIFMLYS